jgi:dTDP-4-amino-4,6-dideoxygalactose transaminase
MRNKRNLNDLAVFGGAPRFDNELHVGRPNIGDRQRLFERLNDILDRRWLTNQGAYVTEFEQRIAELTGVRHCIATSNATVGLEIAIRALRLGGEVIVPSLTFVATAHVLRWLGLQPVFCDVDPVTFTLDPIRVEELITSRTSAILGVHLWGRACQVDALMRIAERFHLEVLFDAAHAVACSDGTRMMGGFGSAEVFSFHATKVCNAFEGGAITTNDDALAERIRLMHNFGFAGYDCVVETGINGKMNEASAAMGLTSLESLDSFIDTNRRNYESYKGALRDVPGIRVLDYDPRAQQNYQYVVVEIDPAQTGISRDALNQLCWAENILTRRYFHPGCHRMEPYCSDPTQRSGPLPITEHATEHFLTLPTGTSVDSTDIQAVCDVLRFTVQHGHQIAAKLDRVEIPA